jgi:protoporphyrinogen oxidase
VQIEDQGPKRIVIVGAGPAGLTAAMELLRQSETSIVIEADRVVGGISRTVLVDGWRFDIGGHRFFTKVDRVERFWHEVLADDKFMSRPRMSRIYYKKKFFDYPLKALNALQNLGILESIRCVASYVWVRLRPPKDVSTFEGWTASRFGWRLYRIFFKTYTEKVWGVDAREIQADWAAQRIKNLSLFKAIANALLPKWRRTSVTSLIDTFQYPQLGPGMLWEECAQTLSAKGTEIKFQSEVVAISHAYGRAQHVVVRETTGLSQEIGLDHLLSSMPLPELVLRASPPAPDSVIAAARGLRHRDFMTVALVVRSEDVFPDNWIYIHEPGVSVGRIQNFRSWSPFMVKDGHTCLGLEYFVNEGDRLWSMADEDLIDLAKRELEHLKLVDIGDVQNGYVVRMPKAYPMYDSTYQENVLTLRKWLNESMSNVQPIGRNGMHRYNNQDHSMLTAMLAVENIFGATHDLWAVNVEEEYHEEKRS